MAWASHHPLTLCPDAVWLTILGGLARHVAHDPGDGPVLFVRHIDKPKLTVPASKFPDGPDEWLPALEDFAGQIEKNTVALWGSWSPCDFSTSGRLERAASRAMLMSAVSPYLDFEMDLCGIASVTLAGEPAGWEAIRDRASILLSRAGLGWWLEELAPVLEQFVLAARDRFDHAFWSGIHTLTPPEFACGGQGTVDGGIHGFFPYFDDWSGVHAGGIHTSMASGKAWPNLQVPAPA